MNKGIELLLQRMESNPEEFSSNKYIVGGGNKWEALLYQYESILDKEDVDAFKAKLREVRKDEFTKAIMQELLNPQLGETLGTNAYNPSWGNVTLGTPPSTMATINANSLSLGNQTLDEETIKHMKEHINHLKQAGKL